MTGLRTMRGSTSLARGTTIDERERVYAER